MTLMSFVEDVKRSFRFLIDDFKFSVANEERNRQTYGVRLVEYRSATTVVIVTYEGLVMVDLGPVSEPRIAQFTLSTVVRFLNPDLANAWIAAIGSVEKPKQTTAGQLTLSARILRQCCEPMLKGDFSQWNEIAKDILKGSREHYKAMTGKELRDSALSHYLRSKGVTLSDET